MSSVRAFCNMPLLWVLDAHKNTRYKELKRFALIRESTMIGSRLVACLSNLFAPHLAPPVSTGSLAARLSTTPRSGPPHTRDAASPPGRCRRTPAPHTPCAASSLICMQGEHVGVFHVGKVHFAQARCRRWCLTVHVRNRQLIGAGMWLITHDVYCR